MRSLGIGRWFGAIYYSGPNFGKAAEAGIDDDIGMRFERLLSGWSCLSRAIHMAGQGKMPVVQVMESKALCLSHV